MISSWLNGSIVRLKQLLSTVQLGPQKFHEVSTNSHAKNRSLFMLTTTLLQSFPWSAVTNGPYWSIIQLKSLSWWRTQTAMSEHGFSKITARYSNGRVGRGLHGYTTRIKPPWPRLLPRLLLV